MNTKLISIFAFLIALPLSSHAVDESTPHPLFFRLNEIIDSRSSESPAEQCENAALFMERRFQSAVSSDSRIDASAYRFIGTVGIDYDCSPPMCTANYYCQIAIVRPDTSIPFTWKAGEAHRIKSGLCKKEAEIAAAESKNLAVETSYWTNFLFQRMCRVGAIQVTLPE